MKTRRSIPLRRLGTCLAISAMLALTACSDDDDDNNNNGALPGETPGTESPDTPTASGPVDVTLSADNEVPAVATAAPDAAGTGTLTVDADTGATSGQVTVSNLTGTASAAHIHRGFAGNAGPVRVPLTGNEDGTVWSVPDGTILEEADREAFARGELYFNVHTAANPAGEVRGQIVPDGTTQFTVRIANVSTAETLEVPSTGESVPVPLSPGAYIVHRAADDSPLLLPRDTANSALEAIAEDGNTAPTSEPNGAGESLGYPAIVPGSVIFDTPVDADMPGPATPGLAYEFTFNAVPGDKLGFVTMFVQSNDWFYTPTDEDNSISLFNDDSTPVSGDVSDQIALWDAGTEIDEEPGSGPNQVLRQSALNTGDPENGSVGSLTSQGKSVTLNGDVIQVTITPGQ